jgi:site-specific DNA-methyltransferase (adenine-specific)
MTITTNLPDLNPWEYDALKESIRRWKVILPVVKDENGEIIDGFQRVRACGELVITDYPVLTLRGLTEDDKRDHALILNLLRRHLNQQQMRDLIAAELRRTPELSDNWLAQILGTTDKTVAAVRQELIATSEIPKLDALRGKDGKYRRVTRIVTNTAKEAERAQQALQILGDDAPRKDLELRLAQRLAKQVQELEMTRGRQVQRPGNGEIRIYRSRFQVVAKVARIRPGSVNLIVTDIPYGKEFLPQVDDLGAFAARMLKPGGLFVTYSGHLYLDQVIRSLSRHLTWAWAIASVWSGEANIIHPRQVTSKWKPILVYSKGDWKNRKRWYDVTQVEEKEKDWHVWQQPLKQVEKLIEDFSEPGDLVLDPLGGGFTGAVACRNLGRCCIACDIDKAAVIRGQDRLAGKEPGLTG